MRRRWALVVAAVAVEVVLALVVVAPQLSPRVRGEEVRLLVEPVDPIDPFRGAYVDLRYARAGNDAVADRLGGLVYVPLVGSGRRPYRLGEPQRERPRRGRFLRCRADGELSCGIESFFASQAEARRLERELRGEDSRRRPRAVARVRVDGAGRAALLSLE